MNVAVMGGGDVGTAISMKLKALGYDVVLGSRQPGDTKNGVPVTTHAYAAARADWIFNAMHGEDALELLVGLDLTGKLLVDLGNFRPAIEHPLNETLGEALQRALPETRVVKAMNFPSAQLMGHPERLSERHSVFIAGNDPDARAQVTRLLKEFGWEDVVDLGDLTACRAMESLAPMWVRLNQQFGHVWFNLSVVRDAESGS